MTEVQSDFLGKWLKDRATATITVNSDTVLDDLVEYVNVDTSSGPVKITLTDTSVTNVEITRQVIISDLGNAGTNAIEIVPNPSDSTSIENISKIFIEEDNGLIILELANIKNWAILANANNFSRAVGAFSMMGNAVVTVINTINVYEEIAGTAIGSPLNEMFVFTTSPNELEYIGSSDITIFGNGSITARRDIGAAVRLSRYTGFLNGVEIAGATTTIDITNTERSGNFPIFTSLVTGDKIKMQTRNEGSTADILAVDLNLIIFQIS